MSRKYLKIEAEKKKLINSTRSRGNPPQNLHDRFGILSGIVGKRVTQKLAEDLLWNSKWRIRACWYNQKAETILFDIRKQIVIVRNLDCEWLRHREIHLDKLLPFSIAPKVPTRFFSQLSKSFGYLSRFFLVH